MKNIIITFVFLVLMHQFLYSQGYTKSALKATGYFGYSIGEKTNLKKIML
jgi:hypothetical protein